VEAVCRTKINMYKFLRTIAIIHVRGTRHKHVVAFTESSSTL
jgi:hypothetical protein